MTSSSAKNAIWFTLAYLTLWSIGAIAVEPKPPIILANTAVSGTGEFFLSEERMAKLRQYEQSRPDIHAHYWKEMSDALVSEPYPSFAYASALGLAYKLTADTRYKARAKVFFDKTYSADPTSGWAGFKGRNSWRTGFSPAALYFNWMQSEMSASEKSAILDNFEIWANYWLDYVNDQNDFDGYRWTDTDETTALALNFILLGKNLESRPISARLISAGDRLFQEFIKERFLDSYMKGGLWAEGSVYSPGTMQLLLQLLIINSENRSKPLGLDYASDAIEAIIYNTLPGYSTTAPYGDIEQGVDYRGLTNTRDHYLMMMLQAAAPDLKSKALAENWLSNVEDNFGLNKTFSGLWTMLFREPNHEKITPEDAGLPTFFAAEGRRYVSMRSDWCDSAVAVHFHGVAQRVDHEQPDSLGYQISRGGKWVSKEVSGYGGPSATSRAHNTLLIQNADADGSSGPTGRPAGWGELLHASHSSDYGYLAGDAKDIYNMAGYYATDYVDRLQRQLFYIKPNILVVYDNLDTDPSATKDLIKYQPQLLGNNSSSYIRRASSIHHFQVSPTNVGDGKFTQVSEGNKYTFRSLLPTDSNIQIVNENQLWSAASQFITENQRKFHLEIAPTTPTEVTEFLSTHLVEGSSGNHSMDEVVLSGSGVSGVYLKTDSGSVALIFAEEVGTQIMNQDIVIEGAGVDQANRVYVLGFAEGASIALSRSSSRLVLSASNNGEPVTGGVASF